MRKWSKITVGNTSKVNIHFKSWGNFHCMDSLKTLNGESCRQIYSKYNFCLISCWESTHTLWGHMPSRLEISRCKVHLFFLFHSIKPVQSSFCIVVLSSKEQGSSDHAISSLLRSSYLSVSILPSKYIPEAHSPSIYEQHEAQTMASSTFLLYSKSLIHTSKVSWLKKCY